MEWLDIVKPAVLLIGGFISIVLAKLAYRIYASDGGEYSRNRQRSGKWNDALLGRLKTSEGGFRNYEVQAGLAVDTKDNVWVEQGKLSDEAIDSVMQPK